MAQSSTLSCGRGWPVPDYSSLDRLLHRLVLGSQFRAEMFHDLERGSFLKSSPEDTGRHVFVTGLARAGTTILMREIYSSGDFGSLTYADMPFVLAPNFWSRVSGKGRNAGPKVERAHGDGIEVDFNSPEALDEVYWRVFTGGDYIHPDRLVPYVPDSEQMAGYRDLVRLVLRRTGASRYLSKNNNNLLRLAPLAKAFPSAVILVPIRDPVDQAGSLLRQHRRFLNTDKFTRDYMGWLAHHEFGADHRPFAWGGKIPEGDPADPAYWLGCWTAAHRRIEALEREHANIQLVPYDALASDAAVWPAIARRIGIEPTQLKEIRLGPGAARRRADRHEAESVETRDLFVQLDKRARQSLGLD